MWSPNVPFWDIEERYIGHGRSVDLQWRPVGSSGVIIKVLDNGVASAAVGLLLRYLTMASSRQQWGYY